MSRHVTRAGINDVVGYLYTQEQADEILQGFPEHEREARAQGIPQLGSGRIFPVPEGDITIAPFEIPAHYAEIGGMDFGWQHPFAGVKLAIDRDADVIYLTHCYRKKEATPLIHSSTLKGWGKKLKWAWPMDGWDTSGKHGTKPGKAYKDAYAEHGLNMLPQHAQGVDGSTGVEAGLMRILERMQTDRWKVFSTCVEWFEEFRLYHRKDGSIVKEFDDLMDASRYAEMMMRFAENKVVRRAAKRQRQKWVV